MPQGVRVKREIVCKSFVAIFTVQGFKLSSSINLCSFLAGIVRLRWIRFAERSILVLDDQLFLYNGFVGERRAFGFLLRVFWLLCVRHLEWTCYASDMPALSARRNHMPFPYLILNKFVTTKQLCLQTTFLSVVLVRFLAACLNNLHLESALQIIK